MKLKDRVAIVTGSSSGIGKAIAIALGREGAIVVVNGRDEKRTAGAAEDIRTLGIRAMHIAADISGEDDVNQMVARTLAEYGRIDILANNAFKIPATTLFHERSMAEIEAEIGTTLMGAMRCCRAVIPYMLKQKSGRIINITSGAGKLGSRRMSIYAACKTGLATFSRAIAKELGAQGITVNCVAPGLIKTPRVIKSVTEVPKINDAYMATIPLRRVGEPEEIASMVVFLASDEAGYITGQEYCVDGGLTA